MQIKSIILYNSQGKQRRLDFELGRVNLLTGDSDTGKSAIIPIISYCLGNHEFEIPEGVIKENVTWYAVLYQIGNKQALVAKPKPKYGNIGIAAFYKESEKISIPDFDELEENYHNIMDDLSLLLRASLNLSKLDPKKIEDLQIGIDNACFYLFQERKVIANDEILFYKQYRNVSKIIKTLPYFLGSKLETEIELQKNLETIKAELKDIDITLTQQQQNKDKYENKIKELFEQAKQLGLIERNLLAETISHDDMITMLKEVCNWQSSALPSESDDLEPQQKEKLNQLKEERQNKKQKLTQYQSYNANVEKYSVEVDEHKMRLQSISLFEDDLFLNNYCPLCESKLEKNTPKILAMQQALNHLNKNLKAATYDKVDYNSQIKLLEDDVSSLEKQIKEELQKLLDIVQTKKSKQNLIEQLKKQTFEIGELIGKVKNFLEFAQITPINEKELKEKIKRLRFESKNISKHLDELRKNLNSNLFKLNETINLYAKQLELNYKGSYFFDLKELDITVNNDSLERPISMKRMGGSLNILGCHLLILLALHKHFLTEKTPVPNFLVLDQPIQGYSTEKTDELEDNDSEKINKIIQLLIEVSQSTGLQIILTEHEQLSQDGLHRVEEHWTKDNALIPSDW